MSANKAAYIEKSCWEKPKTTSGNRSELRTHLIPKECLCHSASDIAGRMTNLALGSKVTSLSIHSGRFSQRIRVSLAHLQVWSPLRDISYRLETRLPRCQAKYSIPPGQQLLRHYSEITDCLQQACENTLPCGSSLCSEPPRRCRSIKVCTGV